jgi:hypothetical protein
MHHYTIGRLHQREAYQTRGCRLEKLNSTIYAYTRSAWPFPIHSIIPGKGRLGAGPYPPKECMLLALYQPGCRNRPIGLTGHWYTRARNLNIVKINRCRAPSLLPPLHNTSLPPVVEIQLLSLSLTHHFPPSSFLFYPTAYITTSSRSLDP